MLGISLWHRQPFSGRKWGTLNLTFSSKWMTKRNFWVKLSSFLVCFLLLIYSTFLEYLHFSNYFRPTPFETNPNSQGSLMLHRLSDVVSLSHSIPSTCRSHNFCNDLSSFELWTILYFSVFQTARFAQGSDSFRRMSAEILVIRFGSFSQSRWARKENASWVGKVAHWTGIWFLLGQFGLWAVLVQVHEGAIGPCMGHRLVFRRFSFGMVVGISLY